MIEFNKLSKFYKKKKVLVIGHTGFKGSWLTLCLNDLGSKVYGISIDIPTNPSHYKLLSMNKHLVNYRLDIRNYSKIKSKIKSIKPDLIFHCAAQSLVKESYKEPYATWTTNLLGSLNIFETLKNLKIKKKLGVVIVTSDKCYRNLNQKKGYKENDLLGDDEPYGASKAAIELAFSSYFRSFFINKKNLRIATARAGNVIGGGDWSKDRIIPDLVRSIKSKKSLEIRYPYSTRPWQHVLEPVYGYMVLAYNLYNDKQKKINGESFNFGPWFSKNYKVIELLNKLKLSFPEIRWVIKKQIKNKLNEAGLLNLNCKKSFDVLKWKNILSFEETVNLTSIWYKNYFKNKNVKLNSLNQINLYKNKLKKIY